MEKQKESKLSDGQKLEINDYVVKLVKSWLVILGTILGTVNIVVLIGALVYIFFILPGKAVTEVKSQIESQLADITKTLNNRINEAYQEYGKAKGELDSLKIGAEELKEAIESAKKDLVKISSTTKVYDSELQSIDELIKRGAKHSTELNGRMGLLNVDVANIEQDLKQREKLSNKIIQRIEAINKNVARLDLTIGQRENHSNEINRRMVLIDTNIKNMEKAIEQGNIETIVDLINTLHGSEDVRDILKKVSIFEKELNEKIDINDVEAFKIRLTKKVKMIKDDFSKLKNDLKENRFSINEIQALLKKNSKTENELFLSQLENGSYVVIVASYNEKKDALKEVEKLIAVHPELFKPQIGNRLYKMYNHEGIYWDGRYWAIYIGGFYSEQAARILRDKIVKEFDFDKESYVRIPSPLKPKELKR